MQKKIVVPLAGNDRAEDFIPYLERVARPGMKVIFAVRYPVGGFRRSPEEFGSRGVREANRLADEYGWDSNRRKAEKRIATASAALSARGIDVAADLYAGSRKRAVRDYSAAGDVHLILTRPGLGERLAGFFSGGKLPFDLFRRPTLSAVLLIDRGIASWDATFGPESVPAGRSGL